MQIWPNGPNEAFERLVRARPCRRGKDDGAPLARCFQPVIQVIGRLFWIKEKGFHIVACSQTITQVLPAEPLIPCTSPAGALRYHQKKPASR